VDLEAQEGWVVPATAVLAQEAVLVPVALAQEAVLVQAVPATVVLVQAALVQEAAVGNILFSVFGKTVISRRGFSYHAR